ncbi:unnamed protein product [Scytosiphon promiscuus]
MGVPSVPAGGEVGQVVMPGGELSEAEKKTIEFGLAVAILASCPTSPSAAGQPEGSSSESTTVSWRDPLRCHQRASKQLRLWQGACLGGLAHTAARGNGPHPSMPDSGGGQEERGTGLQGGQRNGPRQNIGDEPPAALEAPQLGRDDGPSTAGSIHRLLATDAASDLRALGAVALSGCESEGARAVQEEALEGIWLGDCSPQTVSLFVKEMLGQVVLCGQGGSGGQIYRHVLDLLVSLVEGVAAAASAIGAAASTVTTTPSTPGHDGIPRNNLEAAKVAAAAATMSRRLDIALAVSEAFDATLVKLARELRGGTCGGRQGLWGRNSGSYRRDRASLWPSPTFTRRHQTAPNEQTQSAAAAAVAAAATARASRAGHYFDAYEAVLACLLQTFDCLASDIPGHEQRKPPSSPLGGAADTPRRNRPPRGSGRVGGDARRPSSPDGPSFGPPQPTGKTTTAISETMVASGLISRGWDAESRRSAWTQRTLGVLAEAMTAMSSFRIGQLRLQRVVSLVYERARLE